MKVLIVDDSKNTRGMVVDMLEGEGISVIEASNGDEGIVMLNEHKPDLVILDLLMPVMDGFEFLEVFNKEKHKIPVIVLTSAISDEMKKECLNHGVKAFLAKPFLLSDVLAAIEPFQV
jgi:CheY-like chemotaxis protein